MLFIQWKWTMGICCGPGVFLFLCASYAFVRSMFSPAPFPWQAWITLPVTLPIIILINLFLITLILLLIAIAVVIFFPLSILSSYAWLVLRWLEERINRLGRRLLTVNWWFISFLGFRPLPPMALR